MSVISPAEGGAPPNGCIYRARGLEKTFPVAGTESFYALRSSTFEVLRGESVAIMGPSGAGKSTLLSLLGLIEPPSSGQLEVAGVDVTSMPDSVLSQMRSQLLGFVFQNHHLISHLTVQENIEMGLRYKVEMSRSLKSRLAREALSRVGLGGREGELPKVLSGGQQQRVAIARALVRDPQVILCDEPTGSLDGATTDVVLKLLLELSENGTTLLVVTHDPSIGAQMGRRILLKDGLAHDHED